MTPPGRKPRRGFFTRPRAYNRRRPLPPPPRSPPMVRRCVPVAVLALLVAAAVAAEPIKLDLADFKLAAAPKGADDLVKYENDTISFFTNGSATAKLKVPADGDYAIVIDASCT